MKLSIITPYYKTLEETKRLAEILEPQLTDEIEWVIIDDGCNEKELDTLKANVIHLEKNSGGASKPRNIGLEVAKGQYIAFIDSDDMVSQDYVKHVLKAIKTCSDLIFISWSSRVQHVKMRIAPPKWNCSVWCRVYKREIIDNIRFDESLRIAEDWKFNKEVRFETTYCIKKTIYFYNNGRKGSLING